MYYKSSALLTIFIVLHRRNLLMTIWKGPITNTKQLWWEARVLFKFDSLRHFFFVVVTWVYMHSMCCMISFFLHLKILVLGPKVLVFRSNLCVHIFICIWSFCLMYRIHCQILRVLLIESMSYCTMVLVIIV